MRSIAAAALLLVVASPVAVYAQAAGYDVATTPLGTLIDDPAAKAVLDKNLPGFASNPQIEQARPMTLKMLQQYMADQLPDAKLAAIQSQLAALPAKK